ncbi:uncharacterized protein LOC133328382 [Musca vetustissima]|uniref:uncharacterized protein LOC133328382 n=1 Tax=Musca vetustissima TaxID=27455 RepID=UPI002AB6D0B4|nr:uncharacterized protein LOC133328382 [Musca vetustissima]
MPWKPSNDFEEEIVNLQPDHDFIFGALSEPEPQPFYPRPQSHIDYAATKKRQSRKQQEEYEETGRINNRLHAIAQVQRIAGTKPLGEQPTLDDWKNNKCSENEIIAMMRHFGLGPSVEEPLSENVTIATYPIKNGVEIVQTKCRKIPLLFDDNLFKLKPKDSSSSTSSNSANSFDSANNNSNNIVGAPTISTSSCDTNSYSYHTPSTGDDAGDDDSTDVSFGNYRRAQDRRYSLLMKQENAMFDYRKLHEEDAGANDTTQSSSCYSMAYSSCGDGYETATTTCSSSGHKLNIEKLIKRETEKKNNRQSRKQINARKNNCE